MSPMNSPEAADVIYELHQTVEEQWEQPAEFQRMLILAASDAGMSDELLGEVGERVEVTHEG